MFNSICRKKLAPSVRLSDAGRIVAISVLLTAWCRADRIPIDGALAFNLSGTPNVGIDVSSGRYVPLDIYKEGGGYGVAFLLPPVPLLQPLGGGPNNGFFMSTLTTAFGAGSGWRFSAAANSLGANTLQINADQVAGGSHNPCFRNAALDCVGIYGPPAPPPPRVGPPAPGVVGFVVTETNPAANGHWLQVLGTNSPAAGRTSPYVDNAGSTTNPYYPGTATGSIFMDSPQRDPTQSQYWIADLYYASGGNAKGTAANPTQVTIYDGMMWGWADLFVSGNWLKFVGIVNNDFRNLTNFDSALGTDLTSVVSQSSLNKIDSEFNAAVPEPSTTVPLVVIGIALICAGWRGGRKPTSPAAVASRRLKPSLGLRMAFAALLALTSQASATTIYSTDPASVNSGNFSAASIPGLIAGDVLVAFSFGYDPITPNLYFTVDRQAIGAPNTAVNDLSNPTIDGGANGDIFYSAGGSGTNSLAIYGTKLGLTPGFFGDNITGLSLLPEKDTVYFTLSPGSPTLAKLHAFPDDVLESGPGGLGIYEQYTSLGLALSTDQVTGLALNTAGNEALFTISQFSPQATTSGGALDPAAVYLTDLGGANSVYRTATSLGLLSGDQIQDIATTVPEPVTALLVGCGLLTLLCVRTRLCRRLKSRVGILSFLAMLAPSVRLDAAETCSTMAGYSPPMQASSSGTLILPNLSTNNFRWISKDTVFGAIDTGVIAAKTFTVSNSTPPRVVFTGSAMGLNFQGSVLLGTYQRGTVNVYNAAKIVSYLISPPTIDVTNIEFDWKSPTQSKDPTAAITLRQNATTPLAFNRPPADPGNVGPTFGEWVKGGVHAPALFVANQMVSIKVRFTTSSNFLMAADISANSEIRGNAQIVQTTTVKFANGLSSPQYVTMPLAIATDAFLNKSTDNWQWQLGNLNGCGTPGTQSVTTGPLTSYTVLGVPQSPWYDTASQQPWVTALDFLMGISEIDDSFSIADAVSRITNFIFSDYGLVYDISGGRTNYANFVAGGGGTTVAQMDLTGYIANPQTCQDGTRAGGGCKVVNCHDQAGAAGSLINLIGGQGSFRYMTPNGYMAKEQLVGRGESNNPFYGISAVYPATLLVTFGCYSPANPAGKRGRSRFANHGFITMPGDMPVDAMGGPFIGTGTLAAYLTGSIDAGASKAAGMLCADLGTVNGGAGDVRAAWKMSLK